MTAFTAPDDQFVVFNPSMPRGKIRHVLFDFDGTLSLVREGWQNVMVPMMVEVLEELKADSSRAELETSILEYVTRLTGKQTIYQMIELADQVRRRGGVPKEPVDYKHEYLNRLEVRIAERIQALDDGTNQPADWLVPGSIEFLEGLRARGARLYLASGTDEPFVLREAKLLGVDKYFDGGIYGAKDDYKQFSKKMIVDKIIAENSLGGPELLGVGDGYVEIQNTKEAGGVALAVPTFEAKPEKFDDWKLNRLIEAGADLAVPNFREHSRLIDYLFDGPASGGR